MSSIVSFEDYQSKIAEFAVYPEVGTGSIISVLYAALGAANEAGEVAGKAKKAMRDDNMTITPERREALLDEAGDVLWYITRLADELGDTMEAVAQRNVDKLLDRNARGVIQGSGDKR